MAAPTDSEHVPNNDLIPSLLLQGVTRRPESPEPFLWLGLVLLLAKCEQVAHQQSLTTLITAVHLVLKLWVVVLLPTTSNQTTSGAEEGPSSETSRRESTKKQSSYFLFRRQPEQQQGSDANGVAASIVLVPVLLQAIHCYCVAVSESDDDMGYDWDLYSLLVAISLFLFEDWGNYWVYVVGTTCAAGVLVLLLLSQVAVQGIFLLFCWILMFGCLSRARCLHEVFTVGEWTIVTSLTTVALSTLMFWEATTYSEDSLYQLVSLLGLFGSGVAFASIDMVAQPSSLIFRIAYVAAIPLGFVELGLWYHARPTRPFPRSLLWLADFLLGAEEPMAPGFPTVPRFYWLLYWLLALAFTLPLAPLEATSVVIARKWFHGMAVLLFAPVTLAAPQLQSLSYAIAVALLLLAECTVRRQASWIDKFYVRYLDIAKDRPETVVVSHMALILGCAGPLWLTECVRLRPPLRVLVSQWGVLSLGIGDAAGALVGRTMGRCEWGHNKRTVEGSLAMLVSMTGASYWLLQSVAGVDLAHDATLTPAWATALVSVTLLEAFTLQLDNLVLPLFGASVFILMSVLATNH